MSAASLTPSRIVTVTFFASVNTVARIGLSVEQSANREHNQQAHKGGKIGDDLFFKIPHHCESPLYARVSFRFRNSCKL